MRILHTVPRLEITKNKLLERVNSCVARNRELESQSYRLHGSNLGSLFSDEIDEFSILDAMRYIVELETSITLQEYNRNFDPD